MRTRFATLCGRGTAIAILCCFAISTPPAMAVSLRGTTSSLNRQNVQARNHDFTFLQTKSQVTRFVQNGWLVPVESNHVYVLKGVSFPFARPEVKLFVERLGQQYSATCGDELVITSLTRPRNYQPRNASPRSVHPTGMALDLRRPYDRGCRSWLERVLLSLEERGVLEATYERRPPHYHVAVYPAPYKEYVAQLQTGQASRRHLVDRGDTLWRIAAKYKTTVAEVKQCNDLRSNKIYPGQILEVPSSR